MNLSSMAAALALCCSIPSYTCSGERFKLPRIRSENKYSLQQNTISINKSKKRIKGKERNEICPCCGWFKKKKCNCGYNTQLREGSD